MKRDCSHLGCSIFRLRLDSSLSLIAQTLHEITENLVEGDDGEFIVKNQRYCRYFSQLQVRIACVCSLPYCHIGPLECTAAEARQAPPGSQLPTINLSATNCRGTRHKTTQNTTKRSLQIVVSGSVVCRVCTCVQRTLEARAQCPLRLRSSEPGGACVVCVCQCAVGAVGAVCVCECVCVCACACACFRK